LKEGDEKMGVLDEVKKWTKSQASSLTDGVKRFKNKSFMEATVAGCAIVAFADGEIKPEEKTKMAGFIERNDALKVFDMSDVITAFEKYVKGFEFDATIGKGEALKSIGKIKKSSEEAKLLVRVCCAIGTADGDFDEDEKRVVREICQELGLNPAEFGLDETPSKSDSGGLPDWMKKK
jgi:tellurite resistance protein TerB